MLTKKPKEEDTKRKSSGEKKLFASKKDRALLVTKMGGSNYGVWKDDFKSMQEGRHISTLPLTPPHFAGITDVEGRTVSLFDLAVLVGLPPMHSYEKNSLFLMSDRKFPIAFVTEEVCAELDVPSGDIMPMPACLQSLTIDSCVVKGDEIIPVINLSSLSKELSNQRWKPVEQTLKPSDIPEKNGSGIAARLFSIGNETFAAAGIDAKKGLMEVSSICPLPFTPDFVMGITLLDSTVVTVIDTLSILGLKESGNEIKVLLSEIRGDSFGFVVDSDEGPAGEAIKTLSLPPIAEREWIKDVLVKGGNLIPLIRLPELLFSQHDELDKEVLEKKYALEDLVETEFGKATIDISQIKLAGHLHALPGMEVKDTLPYRPCRRLPHLPSIIQGIVEHNGKLLPLLDMGACFGGYSKPTDKWKMILMENGDFSALILTESTPKEKSLPPDICWAMPIAMDHKFIYGCYPDSENRDIRLLINVFELAVFFDEKTVKDVFAFTLESVKQLEAEQIEDERLEAERLEAERLEAERLEAERLGAE
ncbi:MAG: chemotaxis protein CheW, partial [Proteobacteria bacterium]|nr:chemotaxis protein CheW [Pseudomonadota bacterium]